MENTELYRKGEEVPCVIKGYDYHKRTYKVETISDHITGYLRSVCNRAITTILRSAMEQKTIVVLRYKGLYEGKMMFWYKLENNGMSAQQTIEIESAEEPKAITEVVEDTPAAEPIDDGEVVAVPFSPADSEYNKILLQSLVSALGEKIDSDVKYELAINIISTNQKLDIDKTLYRTLFNMATNKYQSRFWSEDILPFCSNGIIRKAWKTADEEGKKMILNKLGISLEDISVIQNAFVSTETATQQGVTDNSQRSTQELDTHATAQAINDRRQYQQQLNNQQQNLRQKSEHLNLQSATIRRQQQEHERRTVQRMVRATNDSERQQIQNESQAESHRIEQQLQNVTSQQNDVRTQISEVTNRIEETQTEITAIQQSAATTTIGGRGKLKINLKWGTIDDVDLHVYDPEGNHIYYGDKVKTCHGIKGQLDVDANAGSYNTTPQENIYWEEDAPIGHYKVDVNLYNKRSCAASIPFTVTMYPEKGDPKIFTHSLHAPKETIHVVEFDYTEQGIKYQD